MENKIYVVARSRITDVDVGSIVAPLGGGGHAYAAAASIKGKTLAQTENKLVEILYSKIKTSRQAKDLMTSPAIKVGAGVSSRDANDLLTRYNINALLVTEKKGTNETLKGYITRQVIEKALFHKLDDIAVNQYMTTELATVSPQADLLEIQEKIIENKQRVLPVLSNGQIAGVITRTDLLNTLVRQTQQPADISANLINEPIHARTRNVSKFMKERLPSRVIQVLRQMGTVADEIGCSAFVVGGFVRDSSLRKNSPSWKEPVFIPTKNSAPL
jgi:tRNA nucleotidyltransferase (CCA-adding enzyme)